MKSRNIKIQTPDGFNLDATYNQVANSRKIVIFAHGLTVARDDEKGFVKSEHLLNKNGISTLRFDFRAHGKSSGNSVKDSTISGELTDLDTVVEFVQKDYKFIGIAGASFGGGIAALYVGKHPNTIYKLFLLNPVLDYDAAFIHPVVPVAKKYFSKLEDQINKYGYKEIGSRKFRMGKKLFEELKKFDPFKELNKYSNDLMIVHGDKDTKISYKTTVKCFNRLTNPNKKLEIIKGSEHGFAKEPYTSKASKLLVDFFS